MARGAAAGGEEPARLRARKKEKGELPRNLTVPGGPRGRVF